MSAPFATTSPVPKDEPIRSSTPYEFEVYLDDGDVGWGWLARYRGKVLVLSTGHPSEFAAHADLDLFRSRVSKKKKHGC